MMSRRTAPIAALLLTLATGLSSQQRGVGPPAGGRPLNIVLLVIDDVRWDSLGAAGNRIVRTPRIDQLAGEGVRFEQARVTTSICMVSRATLLTGQYMSRHGVTTFGVSSRTTFANTFPPCFRRGVTGAGYVGKYGVGPPPNRTSTSFGRMKRTHWQAGPAGQRIHVTERNARDSIDFLQGRPKDRPPDGRLLRGARTGQRAGAVLRRTGRKRSTKA